MGWPAAVHLLSGLIAVGPDSGWTVPRRTVVPSPLCPDEREADMSEMTLQVGGMGCRRCVREVTARLRDVVGVETVIADARRSVVLLRGSMALGDVLAAFAGTTYRVEVLDNSGTTGAGQWRP